MESKFVQQLYALYFRKKFNIKQMLDITIQQTELIKNQEAECIEESLGKRQKLMDDIDLIDGEIGLIEKQLPDTASAKPIKDERIIALQTEIQSLLNQIINQDEKNKAKLQQDFNTVRQKLKDLKGKKAIQQAYSPQKQQQGFGYFIDRKK